MSLPLAELIALVQEQVQKSFDYSAQMETIGRDSNQSDIQMRLSEAEVELPMQITAQETPLPVKDIKKLVTEGKSIDISNTLLRMPSLNKDVEFALRDRLTIEQVKNLSDDALHRDDPQEGGKSDTPKSSDDVSLPELLTQIQRERIDALDWKNIQQRKAFILKTANVDPPKGDSEPHNIGAGRIVLKFKAVDIS